MPVVVIWVAVSLLVAALAFTTASIAYILGFNYLQWLIPWVIFGGAISLTFRYIKGRRG